MPARGGMWRREGRVPAAKRYRAVPRRSYRKRGRHRFHEPVFIVPFGYGHYATHPCYDWRLGPRGWGYYWNYWRCPL